MPDIDYSSYQEQVEEFNNTFGVKFRFEDLDASIAKFQMLSETFSLKPKKDLSTEDGVYRDYFQTIYKQALVSLQRLDVPKVDSVEYYDKFEKLMNSYREARKSANKTAPSPNGAWKSRKEGFEAMKEATEQVPGTRYKIMLEDYKARNVRLRDMRAKVESMKNGNYEAKDLTKVILYHGALQRKLMEPTRSLRDFFRRRSEERDLKMLYNFISTQTNSKHFKEATMNSNAEPLIPVRIVLDEKIKEQQQQSMEANQREQVPNLETAVNPEKNQVKTKQTSPFTTEKEETKEITQGTLSTHS